MNAGEIVGLLADPDRRRVVAAMILGATTSDDIARTAGLDTRDSRHVAVCTWSGVCR